MYLFGLLVVGKRLTHMLFKSALIQRGNPLFEFNVRYRDLSALFIDHTDHRRCLDSGKAVNNLLDLPGVDIDPFGDV